MPGRDLVRFANDIQMMNRSGLIKTMNVPPEPIEMACDWPLASLRLCTHESNLRRIVAQ